MATATSDATLDATVTPGTDRPRGRLSGFPFYPFLLAAYPVLLLYADNITDVEATDVIAPLAVVLAITLALVAVITLVTRDVRRSAIVTSAIMIPAMLFGIMREFADPTQATVTLQSLRGIVMALGATAVIIVIGLYLAAKGKWLQPLTRGANALSIVLVAMALWPIFTFAVSSGANGGQSDRDLASTAMGAGATLMSEPRDVYHLVFDRYGSATALAGELGIDNSEFVEQLERLGFHVAHRSRANYLKTTMSLASTLSMSTLDALAAEMGAGNSNAGPIVDRIKSNRAGAQLQDLGYEHNHLGSYYGKTRASDVADNVLVPASHRSFTDALLARSILSIDPANHGDVQAMVAEASDFQFAELDRIAADPGPTYTLAHVLLPHRPFVFLEDGTYAPAKATFESQLRYTNRRILDFVEPLLALPKAERPIIILQADEGPFPWRYLADESGFAWSTATEDELLMKFGILNAMYLPGPEGLKPLRDDITAINTYPELFRRYFGATIEDLPDRSFTSPHERPYDLTDVTSGLDQAASRLLVEP